MDPIRPFVALVTLAVALGVAGAAVILLTHTLLSDGALNAPALGALVVVTIAVLAAVAVGRRSGEWVANPERYW